MDDLISRQAAIEKILGQPPEAHYPSWYAAQIEKLPPAPPEYLAEQAGILVTDSDTISRTKAIEALDKRFDSIPMEQTSEILMLRKDLRELPPAQLGANLAEVGTDCVSRQAAIEAVEFGITYAKAINKETGEVTALFEESNAELQEAADRIKQLPPVQQEPHWIPVTERLPEIGEYVLCTVKQPYRGRFHVCKYVDKDKWRDHPYFDWWHNGFPDVVAWMPLPEPYKGVTT